MKRLLGATSPFGRNAPIYRMLLYCVVVGVMGGVAALAFDGAVDLCQQGLLVRIGGYEPPSLEAPVPVEPPPWPSRLRLPLVLALGGLISGFLVYWLAPEAEGHGTDAAIAAYHQLGARVRRRVPLVKLVTSALTIGSGGVAGREGPTAQISVGLANVLGDLFDVRGRERRHLLLVGMAAGLAAMFRAPLGMSIFAVEILYSGMAFEAEALIYTVVAAVTAYATYGVFEGWDPLFSIPAGLAFDSPVSLATFALLGVAAGAAGAVLPTLFYTVQDLFSRLPGPPHYRPAVGGLLVGAMALAFPEVLGTGYGWIELAMAEKLPLALLVVLLLLKAPAMAFTIGSGGSGGVFAPTVVLGGMLGAVVGEGLKLWGFGGVPVSAYIVVGMAAVFAGAARTPISTLIMVIEMTGGYGLMVPAMLANVLAFVTQQVLTEGRRYQTLYHSQVGQPSDSPLHRGVFVRRAVEMIEEGRVDRNDLRLPHLLALLRYGEPIALGAGGGVLCAFEIEQRSELDGTTVAEGIGGLEGVTAVAVLRGKEMLVPRGDTALQAGDQLFAVVREDSRERLERATRRCPAETETTAGSAVRSELE